MGILHETAFNPEGLGPPGSKPQEYQIQGVMQKGHESSRGVGMYRWGGGRGRGGEEALPQPS